MTEDDPIVTMADARAFGFCAHGIRRYLRDSGLDLRVFIRDGYRASIAAASGPQGARLAQYVKDRRRG